MQERGKAIKLKATPKRRSQSDVQSRKRREEFIHEIMKTKFNEKISFNPNKKHHILNDNTAFYVLCLAIFSSQTSGKKNARHGKKQNKSKNLSNKFPMFFAFS